MMTKTLITTAALAFIACAAQAEPVTYNFDPTHTWTTWEIPHMGTSTLRGRFDRKEGSVTIDRAAKTGKLELTIDTTSINTGIDPFNKHLSSKDFFNVAEFPSAKFSADKFTFDGAKVSSVSGSLTLLGKTLPVTLTAKNFNCYDHPMLKREVCGGDFETTIKRSQWGMAYGIGYSSDDVRLQVQVEAVKQQ
jgi:polyisoprenoid-binding protein YceI